ncbi:MAG: hypothetical protein KAU26_07920, partial [Methylococcales bacterium]|nr:hypothetical protein [Methylococcales bacterium]
MSTIISPNFVLARFIPITIDQLIHTLCQSEALSVAQKPHMQAFCQQYRALYSAQTLPIFQKLTHHYSPFNPDIESAYNTQYANHEKQVLEDQLLEKVSQLLNNANYEQLSLAELKSVLEETSPYGVKVSVDFNDFSEILVFYRGHKSRHKEQRDWKHFYLTTKTQ